MSYLPLDDRARELLAGLDHRTQNLFWGQAGTLWLDRNSNFAATAEAFLEH